MAALSGQITVTTAGTAVQGPSTPTARYFAIKAHPDNTGIIWVGSDGEGDVASTNGFPLEAGEGVVVDAKETGNGSLSAHWFDASVNGEKACWLIVGGRFG